MQVLAFYSPGSGSSIPQFSRTEKTKSHPILAVQQLPGPYSLVPSPYSLVPGPVFRLKFGAKKRLKTTKNQPNTAIFRYFSRFLSTPSRAFPHNIYTQAPSFFKKRPALQIGRAH